ncbi:hypothetical protein F4679DRAFT_560234 [Xylaria curta]|nr:hypothetical protein F4679DRAFT_560234 [Xylaria curta]
MDPLSVTASVAGLLTAAHEVTKLLGPYISASRETPSIAAYVRDETESTRTVLVGLQTFVRELSGRFSPGGALVGVDQVVAILTSGVLLFAELEGVVQGLVVASPSLLIKGESMERVPGVLGLSPTRHRLPLRARMQWAHQEESLKSLLARLQGFKVSVTVVLTLLQCDSDRRAQQLQMELAANVGALLESNHELSRRMAHLEYALDTQTIQSRQSIMSVLATAKSEAEGGVTVSLPISAAAEQPVSVTSTSTSSASPSGDTMSLAPDSVLKSAFEFESDLNMSRVYRRAQRDTMDFSFRSSVTNKRAWSMLSSHSLAHISVLSVIALPLDLEDITNRHHYIDTNDAPEVEDDPSTPISETSLVEEGSIFEDCLNIHCQLLQIPGFRELFNNQWQVQWEEKGVGMSATMQGKDNIEPVWQQLDVLKALKGIFKEDIGYRLLIKNELGRYLDKEVHRDSNRSTGQKATYLFQLLYIDLNFSPKRLPCDNDSLIKDNVYFLQILACLSQDLERLAIAGAIDFRKRDNLDALISSMGKSNLLSDSAYKQALENFVDDQRSFVRNLLCLISVSETVAQYSSPLLVPDQFRKMTQLLSSYANSEIELLFTIERMLLAPPRLHLWAAVVHQWSVTTKAHRISMIIEEQKVRRAFRDVLASEWRSVQRDRTLIMTCLELLSEPLQIFPRAAYFFQEIIDILLGEFSGIGAISPAQKDDFRECERLVKDTLRTTEGEVGQNELSQALQDLILHIQGWKSHRIEEFGRLVRVDNLGVSRIRLRQPRQYHIYLFENILLCIGDVTDEPYKLLLKGSIFLRRIGDIHCHIRPGSYKAQVWYQSDDHWVMTIWFSFLSEWQMLEWCRSLIELTRSHHQPPAARLYVQTKAMMVFRSLYTNGSNDDDQDHLGNIKSGSMVSAMDARTIQPTLLAPSWPLPDRPLSLPVPPISHRGYLLPPPRLRDRQFLLSPLGKAEELEENMMWQGDSGSDIIGLAV